MKSDVHKGFREVVDKSRAPIMAAAHVSKKYPLIGFMGAAALISGDPLNIYSAGQRIKTISKAENDFDMTFPGQSFNVQSNMHMTWAQNWINANQEEIKSASVMEGIANEFVSITRKYGKRRIKEEIGISNPTPSAVPKKSRGGIVSGIKRRYSSKIKSVLRQS